MGRYAYTQTAWLGSPTKLLFTINNMSCPKSIIISEVVGPLTWHKETSKYRFDVTFTHECTQEAIAADKTLKKTIKVDELARDSTIITKAADDDIAWIEAGEATKV